LRLQWLDKTVLLAFKKNANDNSWQLACLLDSNKQTGTHTYIQGLISIHPQYSCMDSVETFSVIVGSIVMVAMFILAGRRSWTDRKEAEHELAQSHRTGDAIEA
jgi:hypothetical protein